MNKKRICLILGFVCLLLTLAVVVQIRTINSKISSINPAYVDNDLRDEVLRTKEEYEEKFKELETAQVDLETKRAEATENDEESAEKEQEVKISEAILGTTDVTGKGIEITLRDNQTVTLDTLGPTEDASNYIIHVEDLQNIVNELKNAGAEAISINDQRILASSTFECAGNIIRINGARVAAPFKIKAIGNQEELYEALKRVGGYLNWLDSWGIITKIDKPNTNLTILKYGGTIKPKYMKEVK